MKRFVGFIISTLFCLPILSSCNNECTHKNTKTENYLAPTCITEGATGQTICKDCNQVIKESEVIPALGHHYVKTSVVEPTPESDGKTSGEICDICGDVKIEPHVIKKTKFAIENSSTLSFDKNNNGSFVYEGYNLYASNVYPGNNIAFSIKHNGLIINETYFNAINKIEIEALGDTDNLFIYFGENVMPILDPTKVSSAKEFVPNNPNTHYFSLSYNGNSQVDIQKLTISYKYSAENHENKALPKVEILTEKRDDGSYTPIPEDKSYVNATINISSDNEKTNIKDAVAKVKIRGNTTSDAPKKPYRIKFDKKQGVFGLTKQKSWVLLAEYFDGSSLHNYITQKMVSYLNGFVFPFHMTHVEVFLNGKSQGLYIFCEQPDEKDGRVNNECEITDTTKPEDISFLIEHNERIGREYDPEDIENETYIKFVDKAGWTRYYDIDYPEIDAFPDYDESNNTSNQFNEWITYLKEMLTNAFNAVLSKKRDEIEKYIDINTLYQMLIIDDFTDECDHCWTSFKMHKEGNGKIKVGPCWDYDTVAFGFRVTDGPCKDPFKDALPANKNYRNPWLAICYSIKSMKKEFYPIYKQYLLNYFSNIKNDLINEYNLISYNLINNAKMWQKGNLVIAFENSRYMVHYLDNRYNELMNGVLADY